MSMLEFYDYLVSSEATHDLALEIADVWADRVLPVLEAAA
jgi:hypothetical protein